MLTPFFKIFLSLVLWITFQLLLSQACLAQVETSTAYNSPGNGSQQPSYFTPTTAYKNALEKIDSIAQSPGIARHFCRVYEATLKYISSQIRDWDSASTRFISTFSVHYVDYFLNPCIASQNGNISPSSPWKFYYSHPGLQTWQFILIGVNAHINADMWRALVDIFSEIEIRHQKINFLASQRSVGKVYRSFLDTLSAQNSHFRLLNHFTGGLPEKIGERILYKWRHRQVKLAILYYCNPQKFGRLLARVNRKKENTDNLILRFSAPTSQDIGKRSCLDAIADIRKP